MTRFLGLGKEHVTGANSPSALGGVPACGNAARRFFILVVSGLVLMFSLIQAVTRWEYAIRDATGILMADSAPRIDQSCTPIRKRLSAGPVLA